MLATDAWAYLNINHPLCAWATYRSALTSPPDQPGFISVWLASTISSSLQPEGLAKLRQESFLEQYRQQFYPEKISRLKGLFCFLEQSDAERAYYKWGRGRTNHFQPEFLAEISLVEANEKRDRLDSNWITYAAQDNFDWVSHYWSGEPYPDKTPLWETLVEGKLLVLGTELRQRAYENVKAMFPDSLMLLELARQATWIGSELGGLFGFLQQHGNEVLLGYLMNIVDANNSDFLARLEQLQREGHPINRADMAPHIANNSFGCVPDLRALFRRFSLADLVEEVSCQIRSLCS